MLLLLLLLASTGVRTLDNRDSTENAGMLANKSTPYSHAPPKQSTPHDNNGHQRITLAKASRMLLFLILFVAIHVRVRVVQFATVVKFATVGKHLGKAGVVANESTRCSHAPAEHSTRYDNSQQQCNEVVVARRIDFCPHSRRTQRMISSDHCTCFTFFGRMCRRKKPIRDYCLL
jgi:hypothetical protein